MSEIRVQFLQWYFVIFILVMFKEACDNLGYVTTKVSVITE